MASGEGDQLHTMVQTLFGGMSDMMRNLVEAGLRAEMENDEEIVVYEKFTKEDYDAFKLKHGINVSSGPVSTGPQEENRTNDDDDDEEEEEESDEDSSDEEWDRESAAADFRRQYEHTIQARKWIQSFRTDKSDGGANLPTTSETTNGAQEKQEEPDTSVNTQQGTQGEKVDKKETATTSFKIDDVD
uniref:Uncharacterized protein n=1 Tax=Knipowitschia caucasica TaxID=637954 RepID=A0AAV2KRR9_KNICA